MTEEAKACYSIVLCRWQNKGKKKKDKSKQVDLYALLGLANERWTATDAQIKLGEQSKLQSCCRRHQCRCPVTAQLLVSCAAVLARMLDMRLVCRLGFCHHLVLAWDCSPVLSASSL